MSYSKYKATLLDWAPTAPENWEIYKLKYILSDHFGGCWGEDEQGDESDLICIRVADFDYQNLLTKPSASTIRHYTKKQIERNQLRDNDLILEKSGGGEKTSVGRVVRFNSCSNATFMFANFCECLRPKQQLVSSTYLAYYLRCFYLIANMKRFINQTTGIQNVDIPKFLSIGVLVPPRTEQDQIVRFLDWKVSTVNRLINVKRRQIKAIDAMKRSIVSSAVTRGINPGVPMKYSGVKWLGDIPAHWETIKLRQLLHPVSVKNHPELPLLSVVREQGVIVRDVTDKEANHNFIPDDLSGYKVVRKGQFAMNKMKAWQGSYGISDFTGIVSPAYFIFNVSFENLEYFHFAIRSKVYVNFFAQASDGIRVGQWDLQMDKMKEIPFIVPPAEEQVAIVEYIKRKLPMYDVAIEKLHAELAVLEEYKARLISDVVTGKIDVRGVEIPEYEPVTEETEASDEESNEEESIEDQED